MLLIAVIAVVWLSLCAVVLALCVSAKHGDAESGTWAVWEDRPAGRRRGSRARPRTRPALR